VNRVFAAALATVGLAFPAIAQAAHFSFTTLDNPADPTFNQLLGINDAGVIAGYFGSGAVGHPNKGYTIAPPYTTFESDNLPGSVQTQATGINAADATTGFWSDTNLGSGDNNFGFIRFTRKNGSHEWFSVNDPAVGGTPLVNQVLGINVDNNAAGFYVDANGVSHGFAYLVNNDTFTQIDIPSAASTAATGINDRNLICGFFVTKTGNTLGFLKPEKGGAAIEFQVPGSTTTQLLGVNNNGIAVGFYLTKAQIPQGLYYDPATAQWQRVADPHGAMGTVVNGLNNVGQLVGFYMDAAGNTHGMVVTVTP
jgi:hypothetical protein